MRTLIRQGIVSLVAVATLSGSACSREAQPFVDPTGKDTTLTDLHDAYIAPTGQATQVATRKTAGNHPIQYWISVPKGWPGNRTWPVLFNITGSSKDFAQQAKVFATARDQGDFPFIVVTPVTLTNSGDGAVPRTHQAYQYPSSTWDLIDQIGRCDFDMNGMAAIAADVRKSYAGQSKAFLTGFSGGGNSTWAMILLRPDVLRAAAPVASNFSGRCVLKETDTPGIVSHAPERVLLPIRTFNGEKDSFRPTGVVQQQAAMDLARANGYTNFSTTVVPNATHEPMPAQVMAYFLSLLSGSER